MPKTPPKEPKDYFASVMFPGSKKLSIVSKRVGTKERLHAIATVTNEGVADRIVEALNHHQGALEKLDAPAQKQVEELNRRLQSEHAVISGLRTELSTLKNDKYRLEQELKRAILERDAAQKVARETA